MRRSAIVLALGAAVYALAIRLLDVTFDATPLLIGVVVLVAAVAGDRPQLAGTGLVLAGWGTAVLAVREGPLPGNRDAAAFLVGAGLGLAATRVLRRLTRSDLGDGGYAVLFGGVSSTSPTTSPSSTSGHCGRPPCSPGRCGRPSTPDVARGCRR